MPYDLSFPEIVGRDSARWMPYQAVVNCAFINDRPTFVNQEHALGVIRDDWPTIADGLDLGPIDGDVDIDSGVTIQDREPVEYEKVSRGARFSAYKRIIKFIVISSGRRKVRNFFTDPGPETDSTKAGGGDPNAVGAVLALMFSNANNEDQFLCLVHWNAVPKPVPQKFGPGDNQRIPAEFHCYAGLDPKKGPDCYRDPGEMIWIEIYIDRFGREINPDTGELIDSSGPADDFGFLTNVGML